jgi:hypothetical protein
MATLRDAIYIKHRQAEQMLFNQRMVNGELSKFEYALYLYQLKEIFFVLARDSVNPEMSVVCNC